MEYNSAIKKTEALTLRSSADGTGDHNIKQNKPDTESELLHALIHLWEPINRTEWWSLEIGKGKGKTERNSTQGH